MSAVASSPSVVIWHQVECGSYVADLALWHELASAAGDGPVLDVGAGTGRVALTLAAAGCDVVALDSDPALLDALTFRAAGAGLSVRTHVADAAAFTLGSRFSLIIVPMQTIQLLPASARAGFFACAQRHLAPGAPVALAIADAIEPFEADEVRLPEPDQLESGGWTFTSQPLAARRVAGAMRLERLRRATSPDGRREETLDELDLELISSRELWAEGRTAGLEPRPSRRIAATDEHVGSEVVMLSA